MISYPYIFSGTVVKGYGRGSKELNIPTANLDENSVGKLPSCLLSGIYYGFAQVNQSPIYRMVMSIGYNPYYKNRKLTAEVHVLHEFENDFYGAVLNVAIMGYIRAEKNFNSTDELVKQIREDIAYARQELDDPKYLQYTKEGNLIDNFQANRSEFAEVESPELYCNH